MGDVVMGGGIGDIWKDKSREFKECFKCGSWHSGREPCKWKCKRCGLVVESRNKPDKCPECEPVCNTGFMFDEAIFKPVVVPISGTWPVGT